MKKIKPTLVCDFSMSFGGMGISAIELAKVLSVSGPVYLVCREGSLLQQKAPEYDLPCPLLVIAFKGNFSWAFIKQMSKILKEKAIENIVFLGASEIRSFYFACWKKNIQFVNWHGTTKSHSKKDLLHSTIYRMIRAHVGNSQHIQRNIREILPIHPSTLVTTIYPSHALGIPFPRKTSEPLQILHVGRIAPGKGHLDAIQACLEGLTANDNYEMHFLGAIEHQELFAQMQQLLEGRPEKNKFFFHKHIADVESFYKKAHILLFPSYGEGFGLVTTEGILHGVLPITYDNTVFPEFLDLGFRFPQAKDRDVSSLAKALKEVVADFASWEPAIRENYRLANELFSRERALREYTEILRCEEASIYS